MSVASSTMPIAPWPIRRSTRSLPASTVPGAARALAAVGVIGQKRILPLGSEEQAPVAVRTRRQTQVGGVGGEAGERRGQGIDREIDVFRGRGEDLARPRVPDPLLHLGVGG